MEVVGAVAGETAKFLLGKLLKIADEEYNLLRGFEKDWTNLKNYLAMVNGVLDDAQKRTIKDDQAVKIWLKNLEDAAYDADNTLDEIRYEYLRRKIEGGYQAEPKRGCLNMPCCTSTSLTYKDKMTHKIKDINANFKRINDQADSLCLKRVRDYPPARDMAIEETTSLMGDPVIIGRQSDENVILEKIISSTCNYVVSVFPIVGMGGIGKTTLARNIFNHQDTQNHFDQRLWICVSENFNQLKLFKRILELLHEGFQGESKEAVVQKLQEKLKGKRYLLVLDDLWNEDKRHWDEFNNTLLGVNSKEGNVIIVTTRSRKVASIVNPRSDPYNLEMLSKEDCWSIIKKRAFEGGDVPKQFEAIGEEIARKCRGLPLLANMMGGVLARKGIDDWQSILQTGLSNLEEGEKGVMQVIRLSYDRLPNSLVKRCFAYCSLFIKDSVIFTDDLIHLWMAEGFLPNDPKSDMEAIGKNIFNMLLQNFFFQEAEEDKYGNIAYCKMHDLLHDLAISVSNSETSNDMIDLTLDDIPHVRHLVAKSVGEKIHKDIKEKGRYLRTLILESSLGSSELTLESRVQQNILAYFKWLHVLKLCGAQIEGLPNSIGKLFHLRYLDLSENPKLEKLPQSICKLFNLQTLMIKHARLQQLPKDMRSLIQLRHLYLDANQDYFEMPPEIGRLSCLQTLTLFCVSNKKGCGIDELGELKNLKGSLQVRNLELVSSKREAEKADVAGKLGLYELHFHWRYDKVTELRSNNDDESVLEGLQPHGNLKGLAIEGFRGRKFPLWARNMRIYKGIGGGNWVTLDKLIEIEFKYCHQVEEIPMLGHLPLLKFLTLEGLPQVKSIGLSFYGLSDGQETRVSFPSLVRLVISKMENLEKWVEPEEKRSLQVFPRLEHFIVSKCRNLSHIPCLGAIIATLQELRIYGCGLKELHDDLYNLESLKTLYIYDCGDLGLIHPCQDGQKRLSSLQTLYFFNCGSLTWFPKLSGMGCLNSLRTLVFGNFSKSMEFSTFEDSFDGIQHMKSLQELRLHGNGGVWVSLPCHIQHLTSLKELKVENFGMEALPGWIGNLSSLEYLRIDLCSKLKYLPSKDAIQQLTKLTKIYIWRCPLLKERCKKDGGPDSEWSKISHIRNMYI